MSYPPSFIKQIQILYKEGLTQKEIALKLNCSLSTVKKAIKEDPEYEEIKQKKKEKSNERHKQTRLNYIEHKRKEREEEERLWWGMVEQQRIHAQMISKKRRITTAQAVELSISQYIQINEKLIYINKHHKPADLPKIYDLHNIILPQFRELTYKTEEEKWTSETERKALE